jgi:hypothetical protein
MDEEVFMIGYLFVRKKTRKYNKRLKHLRTFKFDQSYRLNRDLLKALKVLKERSFNNLCQLFSFDNKRV